MICGSPWPPSDNAQGGFNDLPTRHFGSIHLQEGQGAQTITPKLMSLLTLAAGEPMRGRKRVVSVFDCCPFDLMLQKDGLGMAFYTCFKMLFQSGE